MAWSSSLKSKLSSLLRSLLRKTASLFIAIATSRPVSMLKRVVRSKAFSYVLAISIFFGFLLFVALRQRTPVNFGRLIGYESLILEGFINTIIVSVIALLGSIVLGFVMYLMTKSKSQALRTIADVFTEIIYGTPLLVMIIVMALLIGPAFNSFNRVVWAVSGIIIYITPYMSNVYRSVFSSISDEQYMAMDLFGFTSTQKYRYIIIPQVLRMLMPPFMNNFSLIIKGSALLNVISFRELFFAIEIFQTRTFAYSEGYLLMWLLYIVITVPLSQLTKFVERRWSLE